MSAATTPGVCQGCGAPTPASRGNRARKWCSERCRKVTLYSRPCLDCGAPTNADGRVTNPSVRCNACANPSWTREGILDALRAWGDDHGGIPPRNTDALPGHAGHGRLPWGTSVTRRFGSWNGALLAAGYALHMDRRPETQTAIEDALRAGGSVRSIADRYGVTPSAIYQRLRVRGMSVHDLRVAA